MTPLAGVKVVSTSSSTRLQRVTERVQGARPRRTHLPLRSVNSFSMAARADVFGTWESRGVGLRDVLGVWGSVEGGWTHFHIWIGRNFHKNNSEREGVAGHVTAKVSDEC